MFTWSHLISCTVSWEWSKSLWNCDLQCCSNLTNFKEWWKIVGATQKLQSTIIGIFNYVLLFHKFYVSNNFDPLLIKKCLKEVLQNPGNPGHLPLVTCYILFFYPPCVLYLLVFSGLVDNFLVARIGAMTSSERFDRLGAFLILGCKQTKNVLKALGSTIRGHP